MKTTSIILVALLAFGCKEKAKKATDEMEADTMEKYEAAMESDWEALFDGKTFKGWHEYLKDGVSNHWKIEDEAMVFYPPENRPNGETYNLISDHEYTDFVLSIDWKISEGGNSGIFWGIKELPEIGQPYETGPEIQVLDNEKHPDAKNGTSHQAGALYDMVSPAKDATKPVGEWNTCVITINHKSNAGSVLLNGVNVVDFELNDPKWSEMIASSKFAGWDHFGKYTTGKLGVQDHGNVVAFKNIKIKQL